MRRAEKKITDRAVMDEILERAEVGRMGTSAEGVPYITPVNFVHKENIIYFHCAFEGRKIDNIKANPRVCFEVDEPLGTVVVGEGACGVNYEYRCVIVEGKARLVEDEEERLEALKLLLKKFEPGKEDEPFDKSILARTAVVEITIEDISGKLSER